MLIVGIGGSPRPASSSVRALRTALDAATQCGADTQCFTGHDIHLPLYDPLSRDRSSEARSLLDGIRHADGIILASPGYHGTISGVVKNALDYVEDLADEDPSYFEGRPVGCIAVAHGWQAAVNTLRTLRDVVHALRGWPTPYGAAINTASDLPSHEQTADRDVPARLHLVGEQVVGFAQMAERFIVEPA